ncbi:PP-loop family-domain-containing protein [Myxozyma melibiosi]|uniref:tRNA(Ile)-lysidine synthetase n=1 Tax=Myxozyma melibiosi TaxID=54550 RepID=A0ABR1F0T7_9ASCO
MSLFRKAMRPLLLPAGKAEPIEVAEFAKTVLRLFKSKIPRVFGLAVSGGVDSMALAYLMHEFAKLHGSRLVAFTVDHGLRPESADEAAQVSKVLRDTIGITDHRVLKIDWRSHNARFDALGAHSGIVERAARVERYRVLVEDMVKREVKHLLIAHTWDDQVETAILNLVRRRTGSGLGGMKELAPLPSCAETFGGADLQLVRPLLGWRKASLMATCNHANVRWFEDATNHDPTYTIRNAIRLLISQPDRLPYALQPQSLAWTIADQNSERTRLDDAARSLLEAEIRRGHLEFDPTTMAVRWTYVPTFTATSAFPSVIDDPDWSTRSLQDSYLYPLIFRGVDVRVIRRFVLMLTEMVAPQENSDVPRWKTASFTRSLFEFVPGRASGTTAAEKMFLMSVQWQRRVKLTTTRRKQWLRQQQREKREKRRQEIKEAHEGVLKLEAADEPNMDIEELSAAIDSAYDIFDLHNTATAPSKSLPGNTKYKVNFSLDGSEYPSFLPSIVEEERKEHERLEKAKEEAAAEAAAGKAAKEAARTRERSPPKEEEEETEKPRPAPAPRKSKLEGVVTWTLTRQPFPSFAMPTRVLRIPSEIEGERYPWSEWVLWDNRIWMRARINLTGGSFGEYYPMYNNEAEERVKAQMAAAREKVIDEAEVFERIDIDEQLHINNGVELTQFSPQPKTSESENEKKKQKTINLLIRPMTEDDINQIGKMGGKTNLAYVDKRAACVRPLHARGSDLSGVDAVTTLPVLHDPELARMVMIPTIGFRAGEYTAGGELVEGTSYHVQYSMKDPLAHLARQEYPEREEKRWLENLS